MICLCCREASHAAYIDMAVGEAKDGQSGGAEMSHPCIKAFRGVLMPTPDPAPSERICPKCGWAIAPGEVECSTCQRIDRYRPRRGPILTFLLAWLSNQPPAALQLADLFSLATPILGVWVLVTTESWAMCLGVECLIGVALVRLYRPRNERRDFRRFLWKMSVWLVYTLVTTAAAVFVYAILTFLSRPGI
jgi:predicted nucleic acid-binding Zn ribbon protein